MASIIVEINRMLIRPDQLALLINILRWLIRTKHFPESKTLLTIQNASQNLDSGKWFGFWEVFLDSGKCFAFWEVFLKSGKRFVLTSHRNILLFSDH